MHSKKTLLIILNVIIFVIASVILIQLLHQSYSKKQTNDVDIYSYVYWSNKFQTSTDTYSLFLKTFEDFPPYKQHLASHMIGEILYITYGLIGIEKCQAEYRYGCYHGFIAMALSEDQDNLTKITRFCDKFPHGVDSCAHGIGHGLMSAESNKDITKALTMCRVVASKTFLYNCSRGIFMEYDFPMNHTNNAFSLSNRQYENNPFSPCEKIHTDFQEACFIERPHWWAKIYNNNFTKIGQLCSEITDQKMQTACYKGIGIIAIQIANSNEKLAQDFCSKLQNLNGKGICLTYTKS